MKPISICVLTIVALAAAFPSEEDASPESKVIIHSIPPQVAVTGAIPIPISEVLKNVMKQEKKDESPVAEDMEGVPKMQKRWWKEEEEAPPPPPPPPHGWGWPSSPAAPPSPSLVGPFAFQLGAYYNPLIPAPVNNYPPAPRPAYNPPNTYSPSPSYSSPASYSPQSSSYSAPSSSYSPQSSSYSAPSSSYTPQSSSYSQPASYSAPSSYSPPASYSAPSYSPPASYSAQSYSPPASYSSPSSYSPPSSYSTPY